MKKPKILIFASGSPEGGGSGFEKLAEASRDGLLGAEIVAVVSNHPDGGVRKRADKLGIPFQHFPKPWGAEEYQCIASESGADFFALSGWLKKVAGLDPKTRFNSKNVFNIHPGPLPEFGGPGMYGHHVHEAVIAAFRRGEITHTAISMHFVTEEYDRGPLFFRYKIRIIASDTIESLASRVNTAEHLHQKFLTDLVIKRLIRWDGVDPKSLVVPRGYVQEGPL